MRSSLNWVAIVCGLLQQIVCGCASLEPFGKTLTGREIPASWTSLGRGWASYYHPDFVGRKTAAGELYDDQVMTAAHPTLPFGTIVFVRRVANGRYVLVRINDRGPYVPGRVIDLSRKAASKIGLVAAGVGRVELFLVPPHDPLIAHL